MITIQNNTLDLLISNIINLASLMKGSFNIDVQITSVNSVLIKIETIFIITILVSIRYICSYLLYYSLI